MADLESGSRTSVSVIELEGPGYVRGMTHGRALREALRQYFEIWRGAIRDTYGMDADRFVRMLLSETDYVSSIRRWTPDLLEEMRGIAAGSGLEFETVYALNLMDEYWAQYGRAKQATGQHCSSLGFLGSNDRPSLLAQNMDLETYRDSFQLVMRIVPEGKDREIMVLSFIGGLGLNGINRSGVAVCVNTLLELSASRGGLPVACVVRGILDRSSHDEAVAFARAVKHASGQNYVIGDRARITDLECSANKIAAFWPEESTDVVWHTNNALQNDDLTPDARLAITQEGSFFSRRAAHSAARLESLRSRLKDSKVPRNVATAKATLAAKDSPDHPVCCPKRGPLESFTFASTVMVLSEPPEFLVAPGPPDTNEYQRFTFARGAP